MTPTATSEPQTFPLPSLLVFPSLVARKALVGQELPDDSELIKATLLSIRAWANYRQALKDYDDGRITLTQEQTFFRVAIRIDALCNRLAGDWHHDFTLFLLPPKE